MITRIVHDNDRIGYGIGGSEPLDLDQITDLPATERNHCYRAFKAFQALIKEQCLAITAFEDQYRG